MAVEGAARSGGWGGVLVTAFAALSISISLVLSPLVYDAGMSAPTLIAVRPLIFALALWLLYRATGRSLALPPAQWRAALGLGVIYMIGTAGYLGSIVTLPVSLAVLVFYTYPLMTLLLTCLLERHWPRPLDLGALLIALLGLVLALGVDFGRLHPVGLALVAAGALAIANSFYWMGRLLGDRDTGAATFHMALSGSAVAGLATLASGSLAWPAGTGGWLLLAAVVVTFIGGFFGMFRGVALVGPVRAATILNLEPVFTIALAFVLLGESLTPLQLCGAGLVVAAVATAQRRG